MKGLECKVCGFIAIDGKAPEKCPVCLAPKESFKEDPIAIVEPSKDTEKLETNKKHIPQISVTKACKLVPDECEDVNIRIGEVIHPMLPEHYIMYIDVYIDKKYVSRTYLAPINMNPAVGLHLKVSKGRITVIGRCNIHGAWMSEAEL